jgi:hypothetical protein
MIDQTLTLFDFDIQNSAEHMNARVGEMYDALSQPKGEKILDASKNLLETVFRTIITDKNGSVEEGRRAATFPNLYAQAKECILLSDESDVVDKLNELCEKAVLIIGQLRNSYGMSSHGRDGYDDKHFGLPESLFVARVSLSITNLLYGKHLDSPLSHLNSRIQYENYADFNDYFDSQEGDDVKVAGILVRPSEVLFNADPIAYKEFLIEYMNQPPQDQEEDV